MLLQLQKKITLGPFWGAIFGAIFDSYWIASHRATGVVMKSVLSLAVEEGVSRAFGRILAPLKTALTERMVAAEAKGGPQQECYSVLS